MKTHDASAAAGPRRQPAAQREAVPAVEGPAGAAAQTETLQAAIDRSPRMLAQQGALQARFGGAASVNETGMPDELKAGIESLSGMDMSGVRVHRNSGRPAQLNALAYAQGHEIHLGPGQEQHLAHEAWHVVQQAQGRVSPTMQMKGGVPVNDDAGLEAEADLMGQQALRMGAEESGAGAVTQQRALRPLNAVPRSAPAAQRRPWLDNEATGVYRDKSLAVDLAFITTVGRSNVGVFIPHARLVALHALISGLIANASRDLGEYFVEENVIKQLSNGYSADPTDLFEAVKPVYVESGRVLNEQAGLRGVPGIVLALVGLGAAGGFRIRDEGGGSRLPEAEGKLYISRAHFGSKNAVLASLGVPVEKFGEYGGVTEVLVGSFEEASAGAHRDRANGANIFAGDGFIYASTVTARLSPSRNYTAAGRDYDALFSGVTDPSPLFTELTNAYEALVAPTSTEWVDDLAGGRDGDQNSVMGRWGALGAAAFHNRFRSGLGGAVPIDQNWEWLHVRGAQIGGETEQGNLLAGTFVANSQMIPFESQIQRWHRGNHGKIFARFSARVRDRILAERIKIEIATQDHPALGTIPKDAPLTIEFFPLEGIVIDKLTGRIHEKSFKEQAEGRAREFEVRRGQLAQPERPLAIQLPPGETGQAPVGSELQPFGQFPEGAVILSQSPTEQSIEGSIGDLFGDLLRSSHPVEVLTPLLQLLGGHDFSIHVPQFGLTFDPAQLLHPEVFFRELAPRRRPRLIRRDPGSFAEGADELDITVKKRSASGDLDLDGVRIKIFRSIAHQPSGQPAALPQLPPIFRHLLPPPSNQ